VAVKVQHPDVQAHAAVDLKCMEILVKAVAWAFPDFQFMWLAEETKKNLPVELDFLHEGRNCEKMEKMFSKFTFLKVPKIYWDLSTKRILTMEFCEGGKVNDREYMDRHGISVNEVVFLIFISTCTMMTYIRETALRATYLSRLDLSSKSKYD
jgi:aarF domain-containing kinase